MNIDKNIAELPGKSRRPFDIANFVLGRGLSVIVVGAVLAVLLAPMAFLNRKPYYHAGGSLLVSPTVRQFLSRQDRTIHGSHRDYSDTQAKRVLTGEVLIDALDSLPKEEWPMYLHGGESTAGAAEALRPRLKAEPVDNSYLIFVSMTSDGPDGVAETVNSVMEAYIRKLEREQESQSHRRLDYLRGEKDSILVGIEEMKIRQGEVAADLKSRSFNEFKNPYYESIVTMQEQYQLAIARELEAGADVDLAERNIEAITPLELDVFADEAVVRNEAVYLIDNWTYQKLQELRGNIDGLTPENPDRVYVEERMSAMNQYLETFKTDLHADFDRILTDKRAFELNEGVTKARTAEEAAKVLTGDLKIAFEEAAETFQRSTELIAGGQELENDAELLRNRLGLVEDSIRDVSLDSKAPTHVTIEERATPPVGSVSDNLAKYLAMVVVGAFGTSLLLAALMEFLDSRIRGIRDLQHALGTPVPEPLPAHTVAEARIKGQLLTTEQLDPVVAVAVRKLVVRLNRVEAGKGGSTFLFSGIHKEAGTSNLAENAAVAFRQYRSRVLYLQIDEALAEEAEGIDTSASDSDPSKMACAALESIQWKNSMGTLRLRAGDGVVCNKLALQKMLKAAAVNLDAVIIDAAPLLESDLTQFLLQSADATILVAVDRRTLYSTLRTGVEFLYQSSIPAFTTVLTGSVTSPMQRLIKWKETSLSYFSNVGLKGLLESIRARKSKAAAAPGSPAGGIPQTV